MTLNKEKSWLSVYLFYSEDLHGFLRNAVIPFVNSCIERRLTDQFFFIRYWENGTHIRLRLKGNNDILENNIRPDLINFFEQYFKDKPSFRERNFKMKDYPESSGWHADNSMLFTKYEPEVERYGGKEAVTIAEQQFYLSSYTVMEILNNQPAFDYGKLIGKAILLHLLSLRAFNLEREEIINLSGFICKAWMPNALKYLSQYGKYTQIQTPEDALMLYDNKFETDKDFLLKYVTSINSRISSDEIYEEKYIHRWYDGMKKINMDLGALYRKDLLHLSPQTFFQFSNDNLKNSTGNILESYIHMTNNRIGILNRDESYIAYIIKRCYEELPLK